MTSTGDAREKASAWAEYLRTHGISTSATVGEIKREAFTAGFDARALLAVPQPEATEGDEREALIELRRQAAAVARGEEKHWTAGIIESLVTALATRPVPVQEDATRLPHICTWGDGSLMPCSCDRGEDHTPELATLPFAATSPLHVESENGVTEAKIRALLDAFITRYGEDGNLTVNDWYYHETGFLPDLYALLERKGD